MKKVQYILLTLAFMLGGILIFSADSRAADPLSDSDEVDVQFTFGSAMTISLSSADIQILGLIPGSTNNSNEIDITVQTNSSTGYNLSATVGDASHNSRNLVHTEGSANFSSIAVGSPVASIATDNTWGFSTNSGTTFSGLPIYSGTPTVLRTSSSAASEITKFLIGAKASTSQLAGTYSNIINFTAVANV